MKNRFTVAGLACLALSLAGLTISAPVSETEQPATVSPTIQEDDPNWDCRINGNQKCGVQIQGVWYVVDFSTTPATAVLR